MGVLLRSYRRHWDATAWLSVSTLLILIHLLTCESHMQQQSAQGCLSALGTVAAEALRTRALSAATAPKVSLAAIAPAGCTTVHGSGLARIVSTQPTPSSVAGVQAADIAYRSMCTATSLGEERRAHLGTRTRALHHAITHALEAG